MDLPAARRRRFRNRKRFLRGLELHMMPRNEGMASVDTAPDLDCRCGITNRCTYALSRISGRAGIVAEAVGLL